MLASFSQVTAFSMLFATSFTSLLFCVIRMSKNYSSFIQRKLQDLNLRNAFTFASLAIKCNRPTLPSFQALYKLQMDSNQHRQGKNLGCYLLHHEVVLTCHPKRNRTFASRSKICCTTIILQGNLSSGGRTRTYEAIRQRIYSPPSLPLEHSRIFKWSLVESNHVLRIFSPAHTPSLPKLRLSAQNIKRNF